MKGELTLQEASAQPDDAPWRGPTRVYDLAKELVVALVAVGLLVTALAVVFSSPDERPLTIRQWASASPADFLQTAMSELAGTSGTANYGPPFNNTPGAGQKIGPVSLARVAGTRIPIDTATDFVTGPLHMQANADPNLQSALATFESATSGRQQAWEKAYNDALNHVTFSSGSAAVPAGDYGPVAAIMNSLLGIARSGALDADLLRTPQFYGTDYTKPLLFLADGSYLAANAQQQHLQGSQWGMMNETGNYPGQAWLWLYTMWYQIPPFTHTGNADALIWLVMAVLTLVLVLVPFIPGLRAIPRYVPAYRLIWRDHYRRLDNDQ